MARTDIETLQVSMVADLQKWQQSLMRMTAATDANMKKIENRVNKMTGTVSSQSSAAAAGMQPIVGQAGNIAAQFQDIGVQLAGGQSPFLIAIQQGTQLTAVLGEAKNPLQALGAAFTSLVNPISLATIAAIALGGAAVQYFTTMIAEGQQSEETLKEQEDLIRRVADRWGDAVPALKAYVDELDRAAQLEELGQATQTAIAGEYEDLVATILTLRAEFNAARVDLEQLGTSAEDIDALQQAFNELDQKARDGTASGADVERVLDLIAKTVGNATTPNLDGLSNTLLTLVGSFAAASRAADEFRRQQAAIANAGAGRDLKERFATQKFIDEQQRLNGLTKEQLELETEVGRVRSEAERGDVVLNEQQALAIAQERLAAEERRAQIEAGNKAGARTERGIERDAERQRQAVTDLLASLTFEEEQLGRTAEQQELYNALHRAGVSLESEFGQQIQAAVISLQEKRGAMDEINAQMQEFRDISQQALSGFIKDMMAGKSAAEALANALGNIGNKLLDKGLDLLFDSIFPGAGTGVKFFANGGIAAFGRPKTFASGGISDTAAIFGEAGPEAAVPLPDGRRIPVDLRMPPMPGTGGGYIDVRASMEVVNGNLVPVITQVSGQIAGQAIKANNKQIPNLLRDTQMRVG